MGCDIHSMAERKSATGYEAITDVPFEEGYRTPFDWRSYGMFGFLADVRNYSDVPPIAARRGWPANASDGAQEEFDTWRGDAHSPSWIGVDELIAFNYDQPVEDRRVTRRTAWGLDGGCTAEPGDGQMTTYREFLGPQFFRDLDRLKEADASRVVFFFDN